MPQTGVLSSSGSAAQKKSPPAWGAHLNHPSPDERRQLTPSPPPQQKLRMPQTEVLSSSGSAAQKKNTQAKCERCGVAKSLRRVGCCKVHYCQNCLAELIQWACSQPGVPLICLACRAPWDVQKLATAIGLDAHPRGATVPGNSH